MDYIFSVAILVGLYVILSTSFNLILGYGGLMSVAHPIFFAFGAYCSGLLAIHLHLPIPVAMVMGGLFASLVSVGLAFTSLRVSGDYLIIASLGFQLGALQVIKNLDFTGGPSGLSFIPSIIEGAARGPIYMAVVFLIAFLGVLLVKWMVTGEYGRIIHAMRDDEIALTALGRNVFGVKLVLFVVSCGMVGFAGALYAHYFLYLSPQQFEIIESAAILTMVVVGGMGTIWGPVIGAVLIVTLPQIIRFLDFPPSVNAPLQGLIYTVLVIFFIFFRPQGIIDASRHESASIIERHQSWRKS